VACPARGCPVPAFESEPGPVMVEPDFSPRRGIVANFAPAGLNPEVQLSLVRIRMAGPAPGVGEIKPRDFGTPGRALRRMTRNAGNREMGAGKRETRSGVPGNRKMGRREALH
jgi:hypothetical protein